MKLQSRIATLVGVTLFLGTIAFAANIRTDYDHHANFERYHTYSWGQVQTQNPLWQDRIKQSVDSALSAKGWQQVPSGGDVTINAFGMTQQKTTLNTYYDNMGGGWFWGGFGESTTVPETYREGTLVVDMFDSNTKHLIWRGSSEGSLSHKTDKNIHNLDKDVNEMFDHFPPR